MFINQAKLIRSRRNALKLSQIGLARRLNITPQFVCNWEKGKSSPPLEYFRQIALHLNLNISQLIRAALKDYEVKHENFFK